MMRPNHLPRRPWSVDHARSRAPTPAPDPEPPSRKVFNCIVDDTALIAGVKRSTRDGIRKWVDHGAIRLFVPLHTLSQLDRLKKGSDRINADAREAIKWLDEVTSLPLIQSTGTVQLEGTDEHFATWEEVEKFMLPQTLLSMDGSQSDEEYSEDLESSYNNLEASDETSMSSTHSLEDRPKTPGSPKSGLSSTALKVDDVSLYQPKASVVSIESAKPTVRNGDDQNGVHAQRKGKSPKNTVPKYLHPLFNHILWRIHQEVNPDAALESFILLTNDSAKQSMSQRFGIRAKRLEQLRDAVGREDREHKNRLALYQRENDLLKATVDLSLAESPATLLAYTPSVDEMDNSDDEDVVLLHRPHLSRSAAPATRTPAVAPAKTAPVQKVLDPNDFGRAGANRGGRGGRGASGAFRARGGRGGRGGFVPRGPYVAPGSHRTSPAAPLDPTKPMDPDSYARPPPRAIAMRGGRRKLWEPN